MAKEKTKLYYDVDDATNEILDATSRKQLRSKANIATLVMKEWADGLFPQSAVQPTQPEASQTGKQQTA
jgi:hypothetical protein